MVAVESEKEGNEKSCSHAGRNSVRLPDSQDSRKQEKKGGGGNRIFCLIIQAKVTLEEQFEIPCPGLPEAESDSVLQKELVARWIQNWGMFVSVLLPRMRSGNLEKAQLAIEALHAPLGIMAKWGRANTGKERKSNTGFASFRMFFRHVLPEFRFMH